MKQIICHETQCPFREFVSTSRGVSLANCYQNGGQTVVGESHFVSFFFFFCRSSHYYAIPSGDEPISPQLVAFLRIFQMCEGLFLVVDTRSVEKTVVRGQNMQISHSLRYRRIDRSDIDESIGQRRTD